MHICSMNVWNMYQHVGQFVISVDQYSIHTWSMWDGAPATQLVKCCYHKGQERRLTLQSKHVWKQTSNYV